MANSIYDVEVQNVRIPRGRAFVWEQDPIERRKNGLAVPSNKVNGEMICKVIVIGKPVVVNGVDWPLDAKVDDWVVCRQYDGEELTDLDIQHRTIAFSLIEAVVVFDVPFIDRKEGHSLRALSNRIIIRKEGEVEKCGYFAIPYGLEDPPATGTVLSVGPGLVREDGSGRNPIPCTVGQRVAFRPYSGCAFELNEEEVQIIPQIDLLGGLRVLEEPKNGD